MASDCVTVPPVCTRLFAPSAPEALTASVPPLTFTPPVKLFVRLSVAVPPLTMSEFVPVKALAMDSVNTVFEKLFNVTGPVPSAPTETALSVAPDTWVPPE